MDTKAMTVAPMWFRECRMHLVLYVLNR